MQIQKKNRRYITSYLRSQYGQKYWDVFEVWRKSWNHRYRRYQMSEGDVLFLHLFIIFILPKFDTLIAFYNSYDFVLEILIICGSDTRMRRPICLLELPEEVYRHCSFSFIFDLCDISDIFSLESKIYQNSFPDHNLICL